ncbi:MAG: CPBP family intramembrane metalloprotease [Clostridia bacterium]|nr:CPBP family intramembrane metalloprotease [Clostridia bacterium]
MENVSVRQDVQQRHPHLQWASVALLIFTGLFTLASLVLTAFVIVSPELENDYSFNMINIIVSQLCCMLPPVVVVCHIKKADFLTVMRLRKGINFLQVLLLIGISFGLIYVANGVNSIFLGVLELTTGYVPSGSELPIDTLPQMIFAAFLYGLLPAFCEEFFFRGLVMRAFERFSAFAAIVFSALIFGIMHGNLQQVLFAAVIGVVLAVVVRQSDSIVPAMVIHFTNNFLAMVINFINSGAAEEEVVMTPVDTITGGFSLVIAGMPILALLIPYIFYTKKRNLKKYGRRDPEELSKGYADLVQAGNLRFTSEGAVKMNPAGRLPVLAYVGLGVFLVTQLTNILTEFLIGIGVLGV